MVGLPGPTVDDTVRWLLQDLQVGGIILFRRNLENLPQVTKLIRACQEIAISASGYPLWVAVDQEGGPVQRLRQPFPEMPSARQLGATAEPATVEAAAQRVGLALRELGINMNLAPVLDVPRTPDCPLWERAYGSDPQHVATFALAALQGYRAAGIVPIAKHFPGLGATQLDSHLDLPTALPGEAEREKDLWPFRQAIAAGVPGIMVAHVMVPEWGEAPASLSPVAVTQVLRRQLQFSGLSLTDDLEMGAIRRHWPMGQAACRAVAAGHDLLLICEQPEHVAEALTALDADPALREVLPLRLARIHQQKRAYLQ